MMQFGRAVRFYHSPSFDFIKMETFLILSLFYFLGFSSVVDEKDKVAQAVQEFTKAVVDANESKLPQ